MTERATAGFTDEQRHAIREGVRHRESARDPRAMRALNHVDVTVREGLEYEAVNRTEPGAVMTIGEPTERGGTGRGATPLSHFLAGVGACLLNQFIRIAVADDLPVSFTGAYVRGEFRRDPGAGFERIVCVVQGEGDLADPALEQLADRAEALCYLHCTLSRAVEMVTVVELDGRERLRRTVGPTAASGAAGSTSGPGEAVRA